MRAPLTLLIIMYVHIIMYCKLMFFLLATGHCHQMQALLALNTVKLYEIISYAYMYIFYIKYNIYITW